MLKRLKSLLGDRPFGRAEETFLVCGLGNPGAQYAETRHNVGFWLVDRLARRLNISLGQRSHQADWGQGPLSGARVVLAKPQTYMNRSDRAVLALMRHCRVLPDRLVVIHDDLDLPMGRLRIRPRGGSGGHRGVDSLLASLGTDAFVRIRLGIGRPPEEQPAAEYVLKEFTLAEREVMERTLEQAAQAVQVIVGEGVTAAMNLFNVTTGG